MIVRVDDLLPKIAEVLLAFRKTPWTKAVVTAEIEKDGAEYRLTYDATRVSLIDNQELWDDLDALFLDMWRRYRDSGEPMWTKVTFTLARSGKANLHFDYPSDA